LRALAADGAAAVDDALALDGDAVTGDEAFICSALSDTPGRSPYCCAKVAPAVSKAVYCASSSP